MRVVTSRGGLELVSCVPWPNRTMALSGENVARAWSERGFFVPIFCGQAVLDVFRLPPHEWLGYLSVRQGIARRWATT